MTAQFAVSLAVLALFLTAAALDWRSSRPNRRRRGTALAAAAGLAFLCFSFVQLRLDPLYDFAAFYCGGSAVAHHLDPYLTASLDACEHAALSFAPGDPRIIPAPQPPYTLALFALVSLLPFPIAMMAWSVIVGASVVVSVLMLRALTGLPLAGIFAGLALGTTFISLLLGQVAAVLVALIVVVAWTLRRERYRSTGILCALALLEPHVGLALCVSIFAFVPRARAALVATGLALALLSFAAVGVATNVEYLTAALPLQGLADSPNAEQFSLTMLLHLAHVTDRPAGQIGFAWYLLMLGLGAVVARGVQRRTGDRAALALIPPALIVFGGAYIHASQLGLAIPAALFIVSRGLPEARIAALAGIFALAVPWYLPASWRSLPYVALLALLAGTLARAGFHLNLRRTSAVAGMIVGAFVLMLFALHFVPKRPVIQLAEPPQAFTAARLKQRLFASYQWALYIRGDATHATITPNGLARKAPYWLGLALIIGGCALTGFSTQRRVADRSEGSFVQA